MKGSPPPPLQGPTRQRERRGSGGLVKLLSIPNYVVPRHGYDAAAVSPVTGGADDSSMGAADKGNKRGARETDR